MLENYFHSNVSNTHEISLESDKEPLGLSLSRSYVLKPKEEIDSNILQRYADMYIGKFPMAQMISERKIIFMFRPSRLQGRLSI